MAGYLYSVLCSNWEGGNASDPIFFTFPTNTPKSLEGKESILKSFREMFSGFSDLKIQNHTACFRPFSPDNKPIIRESDYIKGLYVSTGAGRNGIKLGPSLGKKALELIDNNWVNFRLSTQKKIKLLL